MVEIVESKLGANDQDLIGGRLYDLRIEILQGEVVESVDLKVDVYFFSKTQEL